MANIHRLIVLLFLSFLSFNSFSAVSKVPSPDPADNCNSSKYPPASYYVSDKNITTIEWVCKPTSPPTNINVCGYNYYASKYNWNPNWSSQCSTKPPINICPPNSVEISGQCTCNEGYEEKNGACVLPNPMHL